MSHLVNFLWIMANKDRMTSWRSRQESDFEQCLNQLQLKLITILVNLLCELGQLITRYDILKVDECSWRSDDSNLT